MNHDAIILGLYLQFGIMCDSSWTYNVEPASAIGSSRVFHNPLGMGVCLFVSFSVDYAHRCHISCIYMYVPPYSGSLINHQPKELTNVRWDVVRAPSASSEPCPAPHLLPCLDIRHAQLHAPLPPTPASVWIIVQCHSYISMAIILFYYYTNTGF